MFNGELHQVTISFGEFRNLGLIENFKVTLENNIDITNVVKK